MNKEHLTKEVEPKKSTKPKKIIKNKQPKKTSKIIKPENYFFLHDGRILKDMIELAECLENINNDIFFHHVNDSRNDFSNWVKDIFENEDLSKEIHHIKEPKQMQIIILKHLAKKRSKND